MKRLHHNHHKPILSRRPRAGLASAYGLRATGREGERSPSPPPPHLLYVTRHCTCAQPVFLGIYQFSFICMLYAFAFAFAFISPLSCLFSISLQEISTRFLMGLCLPVGLSPANRFYCSGLPRICVYVPVCIGFSSMH